MRSYYNLKTSPYHLLLREGNRILFHMECLPSPHRRKTKDEVKITLQTSPYPLLKGEGNCTLFHVDLYLLLIGEGPRMRSYYNLKTSPYPLLKGEGNCTMFHVKQIQFKFYMWNLSTNKMSLILRKRCRAQTLVYNICYPIDSSSPLEQG